MSKNEPDRRQKAVLQVMYIIEKSGVAPQGMTKKQVIDAAEAFAFVLLEHYGIEL